MNDNILNSDHAAGDAFIKLTVCLWFDGAKDYELVIWLAWRIERQWNQLTDVHTKIYTDKRGDYERAWHISFLFALSFVKSFIQNLTLHKQEVNIFWKKKFCAF